MLCNNGGNMDQIKYFQKKLLKYSNEKFDVDKYREIDFFKTHTAFEGTPQKHPESKDKILILTDPFDQLAPIYEFTLKSVGNIEEIDTISSVDGESANRVRVWIKKGSVALTYKPFYVE